MARKVSGGLSGSPSVGALNVAPTAVVTAATDQNITLSPVGTASVVITNNTILNSQSDLRFGDSDSSNWVAFQGPETISSNVTWTLPAADGSAGQFLSTNASGTLSWASGSLSITDQPSTATVHYPLITTVVGGTIIAANVTSSKLSFQPSTGTLSSTIFNGALATSVSQQISGLGVGTAASATTGEIRATNQITSFFSSDSRFKENIVDIPNALETVIAIGGKLFDWTESYITSHGGEDGYFVQKQDFGVIAQDVQRVFPRAVRTREDGTLAVDYEKLSALAFAAIIELNKKIETLKEI